MGARTFLGLDANAWIAIATSALVLVTGAYVVVTGRLAKRAGESARSAERAAQSSERAAQATQRMAETAEAALSVDFEVVYEPDSEDDDEYFESLDPTKVHPDEDAFRALKVECLDATVYVHGLEVFFCGLPGTWFAG